MRVLIAARRGASGVRTYTEMLAEALSARGEEVFLLDETAQEIATETAKAAWRTVPLRPPPDTQRCLQPLAGLLRRSEVSAHARNIDADIVHATHLDLAPRFRSLVVTAWDPIVGPVARYRAARSRGERPATEVEYALIDASACRRAAAIVAVTPAVARAMRRFRRPIDHVPPFLPGELIQQSTTRSTDVVMITRGYGMRKGLKLAVDAVAEVRKRRRDTRLVIIGPQAPHPAHLPDFCEVRGPVAPRSGDGRVARIRMCCARESLGGVQLRRS